MFFIARKMLNPRDSGKYIASHSKHVQIVKEGVEKAAKLVYNAIVDGSIEKTSWYATHNKYPDRQAVDWCFVADLLNFSFWTSDDDKFEVTYKGKTETGYYASCALINRAIENGIPITDCSYYGQITKEKLIELFTGDHNRVIPMLEERHKCLLQAARVLKDKFNGTFFTCVQLAENSAKKLLEIVVENFESFRDVAFYNGIQVSFLKRAQILVADVFECLQGKSPGNFTDINILTMFADYRVPQVLVYVGALQYSTELRDVLEKGTLIEPGCAMEVEIRGCSIECVEQIVQAVRLALKNGGLDENKINSASLDYFLWCYRRQYAQEISTIPFHRVRSIYY